MINTIQKFVIITLPRSGSTVLVKTLDNHPQIFCAGELFYFSGKIYHTECQFPFWRIKFLPNKINYLINFPNVMARLGKFMDKFYAPKEKATVQAIGFKMMYQHILYMPGIMHYLEKKNVKVILLTRNDILRNVLSDMKARETGVYHNETGIIQEKSEKFHVDLQFLSNKINETRAWANKLETVVKNLETLKIDYADFEEWDILTGKIFAFLGVDQIPMEPAVKRLNPTTLSDMIENFDEVKTWAEKNGYSTYL